MFQLVVHLLKQNQNQIKEEEKNVLLIWDGPISVVTKWVWKKLIPATLIV